MSALQWAFALTAAAVATSANHRAIPGFATTAGDTTRLAAMNTAKPQIFQLSLIPAGNWHPRRHTPTMVVLHNGSRTVDRTFNMFNAPGQPSSHILTGPNVWHQCLPGDATGQHATGVNLVSVGLDICQPWEASDLEVARALGLNVELVPCPRYAGAPSQVVSLDPAIRRATGAAVACVLWGYGLGWPSFPPALTRYGPERCIAEGWNVVAHAHAEPTAGRRQDPWMWWPDLVREINVQYKLLASARAPRSFDLAS